ncbi:MAG: hypothetical protein QGH33_15335 [Pirellulaceae bacterium]|nr:hypothetical protein [Pirellulaceae bacterium]
MPVLQSLRDSCFLADPNVNEVAANRRARLVERFLRFDGRRSRMFNSLSDFVTLLRSNMERVVHELKLWLTILED